MSEVKVPDIGDFSDVPVIEVLVAVGDEVSEEDPLVTLESEKASMDVPAPAPGTVEELLVDVGDTVSEGDTILRLSDGAGGGGESSEEGEGSEAEDREGDEDADEDEGDEGDAEADDAEGNEPRAAAAGEWEGGEEPRANEADGRATPDRDLPVYASPAVRKRARQRGIDLSRVEGSGRRGRITVEDVEGFEDEEEAGGGPAASSGGGGGWPEDLELAPWPRPDHAKHGETERVELSRIKRISGPNLARNWVYIPHVTHHDEADITDLEQFRKRANSEQDEAKLTMVALLLKALVPVLQRYPEFNSSLDGDSLVLKRHYHLGFAADTPQGLLVPVIRDVDGKGLIEIARELAELSAKAREGKLSPTEMAGATFTLSSLGGIGGTAFTPIVNAPQVAILGATRAATRPVWDGEQFVPRLMLPLDLSYDHRVVDGAAAARFCVALVEVLEDYRRILL